MERVFIQTEVISYNDLVKWGSVAEAGEKGFLRRKGKDDA